jgi:hypothetical protein
MATRLNTLGHALTLNPRLLGLAWPPNLRAAKGSWV